jgi:hypothetical protein
MSSDENTKRHGIEKTLARLLEESRGVSALPNKTSHQSALSTHLNRLAGLIHGHVLDDVTEEKPTATSVSDLVEMLNRLVAKSS